jgi:hypothetical protein
MSQIEEIIVELIESRIADYDFGRIVDDAISYNDDVQGHESRIDDLENIDVESTLTEFGGRIDEIESNNDHGAMQLMVASVAEITRRLGELETRNDTAAADNPPANQIDLIMPRNPMVLGYGSMEQLREYVSATLAGTGQSETLLIEMVFATARRIIDIELGIDSKL